MKFQFPNTPHNGIPFDAASAKEIADHQMAARVLWCEYCDDTVLVNILDITPTSEIVPEDGDDKWTELFNDTLFAVSDDYFVITCPSCGLIHPLYKVGA